MNNFLRQTRRSSGRKAMLVVTGMLCLSYLGVNLYCQCFPETASHHEMPVETIVEHAHEDYHEQAPTPHSACDCIGLENVALVSSPVPELVKHSTVEPLVSESFSVIALLLPPPGSYLLSFNHHGPPQEVPLRIKNQVFLI